MTRVRILLCPLTKDEHIWGSDVVFGPSYGPIESHNDRTTNRSFSSLQEPESAISAEVANLSELEQGRWNPPNRDAHHHAWPTQQHVATRAPSYASSGRGLLVTSDATVW